MAVFFSKKLSLFKLNILAVCGKKLKETDLKIRYTLCKYDYYIY